MNLTEKQFEEKVVARVRAAVEGLIIKDEFIHIKPYVSGTYTWDMDNNESKEFCAVTVFPDNLHDIIQVLIDADINEDAYISELGEVYQVFTNLYSLMWRTDEEIKQKVSDMMRKYRKSIFHDVETTQASSKDKLEWKVTYDYDVDQYNLYCLSVSDNDYSVYDADGQYIKYVSVD